MMRRLCPVVVFISDLRDMVIADLALETETETQRQWQYIVVNLHASSWGRLLAPSHRLAAQQQRSALRIILLPHVVVFFDCAA